MGDELGTPVRNNRGRQAMEAEDVEVEKLGCSFRGGRRTGDKMSLFGESIRNNKDSGARNLPFIRGLWETFDEVYRDVSPATFRNRERS